MWQKFLADFLAGVVENRPDETFWPWWSPVFVVFNLDQKKKSYDILKSGNAKFWKIAFTPPIENETPEFPTIFLGWLCQSFAAHKKTHVCGEGSWL